MDAGGDEGEHGVWIWGAFVDCGGASGMRVDGGGGRLLGECIRKKYESECCKEGYQVHSRSLGMIEIV